MKVKHYHITQTSVVITAPMLPNSPNLQAILPLYAAHQLPKIHTESPGFSPKNTTVNMRCAGPTPGSPSSHCNLKSPSTPVPKSPSHPSPTHIAPVLPKHTHVSLAEQPAGSWASSTVPEQGFAWRVLGGGCSAVGLLGTGRGTGVWGQIWRELWARALRDKISAHAGGENCANFVREGFVSVYLVCVGWRWTDCWEGDYLIADQKVWNVWPW